MAAVVQIIHHCSDDSASDIWYDILIDSIPKTDPIHRMLKLYQRAGLPLARHTICWPNDCAVGNALSEQDVKDMRSFDLRAYTSYAPAANAPCVIVGRYVVATI
jgi:hypothetical protein